MPPDAAATSPDPTREGIEVPGPAALLLDSPRLTASGRARHLGSSLLGKGRQRTHAHERRAPRSTSPEVGPGHSRCAPPARADTDALFGLTPLCQRRPAGPTAPVPFRPWGR